MLTRSSTLTAGFGLITVGVVTAALWFHDDNVQRLGLAAVIIGVVLSIACAITRNINATNRPADHAYEIGYDMGYDKGYHEGRKSTRLAVVPLRADVPAVKNG